MSDSARPVPNMQMLTYSAPMGVPLPIVWI